MKCALTSKNQATIPKAVRDYLHLKPGDRIEFFLHPDGSAVLLPKRPVTALRGIVRPRHPSVTLDDMDEMDEAIAAGAAAESP